MDIEMCIRDRPPGKKLQMLSLLSGGERALTAIAILFAMLRLKPTPFCFLDEIEAALDDGNISTFADYLRDFSKDTQFVVVTHRKGTMERCDGLYGVATVSYTHLFQRTRHLLRHSSGAEHGGGRRCGCHPRRGCQADRRNGRISHFPVQTGLE